MSKLWNSKRVNLLTGGLAIGLVGWFFFITEVHLGKVKDGLIDTHKKENKSLRSQNARLIQTVAMLHRGIDVDRKRIEEFKLEGEG